MKSTHLHYDCFCGVSGDMTLGALVDLGASLNEIKTCLSRLPIGPFDLRAQPVMRQGISGTHVHVEVHEDHHHHHHDDHHGHKHHAHHHLRDIEQIVKAAGLPPRAERRALAAYRLLAEAEAHVHGTTPEKIHFHEVGAKDAIVDVAGSMVALELLGIETVSCGPVVVGFGTIQCMHGLMPVPAPATAQLLRGVPQRAGLWEAEMTTPTGAAILGALLAEPGSGCLGDQSLTVEKIGYGAGTRQLEGCPNYLRLDLCQSPTAAGTADDWDVQTIVRLQTEIDDMSPELTGHLMESLLGQGALDVHFTPVQMKKGRPGVSVTVLCETSARPALTRALLTQTTTFGVRWEAIQRACLKRRAASVATPLGEVKVKEGWLEGRVLKVTPEFESCRALAAASGRPLNEIYDAARRAIDKQYQLGSLA